MTSSANPLAKNDLPGIEVLKIRTKLSDWMVILYSNYCIYRAVLVEMWTLKTYNRDNLFFNNIG